MPRLARPQEAYDRFSAATGLPLAILALLWLPILVVPLVAHLPAGLADTFDVISYVVWAVFAAEYLVKLYLAPSRRRFFTCHLLDLAVVALPVLRPLRALRLLRLLTLTRVGVVLASALKRAREVFTHRGLYVVLLAVLGIVSPARPQSSDSSSTPLGRRSTTTATPSGGPLSPSPPWATATGIRSRPTAGAWRWC